MLQTSLEKWSGLASDKVRRQDQKERDSRQGRRLSSPPQGSLGPLRVSSPKHLPLQLNQHKGG